MTTRAAVADVALGAVLLGYHAAVHGRERREHRLALNLAAVGVAVAGARVGGITTAEMGLARDAATRGARLGTFVALPIVAGLGAALAARRSRRYLHDERVETLAGRDAAFELLVRIPLETALAEEILFRGVHFAVARRRGSTARAVAVTSLVFGLWHVPPARSALNRSRAGRRFDARPIERHGAVVGQVVATTIAGIGFAALRVRSDSVVAPIVVHAALNAAALGGAWVVHRVD